MDKDGADILEFQQELLSDDEFLAPVYRMIEEGRSADRAWLSMIDAEISDYSAGDDQHFSARADDLKDLRQRVLTILQGATVGHDGSDISELNGLILAASSLTPSEFLALNLKGIKGIALGDGSPTSHVSILARARGIPMLVGCGGKLMGLRNGLTAVIDTENRQLVHNPDALSKAQLELRLTGLRSKNHEALAQAALRAISRSGDVVKVFANIDDPVLLSAVDVTHFDGVGLTRTEFLFEGETLPNEDEQFAVYRRILSWADGRPVTIRTLDAGGDKPIAGVTLDGAANPFLGIRGYRLSKLRPSLFKTQLRALARAAIYGELKVMIPMVTVSEEFDEFRALFVKIIRDLEQEGIASALPALGVMIEVPAAALCAETFDAAFYSIGSNDLIQYTTACARDATSLNYLARADNGGVIKLIAMVVAAAEKKGCELSVCGDMASMPQMIPVLLSLGVRTLSVAIAQGPLVKQTIRNWSGNTDSGSVLRG